MIVWEYEEGKLLLLFVFWDSLVDDCISILDVSVCEVDEMWVLMFNLVDIVKFLVVLFLFFEIFLFLYRLLWEYFVLGVFYLCLIMYR